MSNLEEYQKVRIEALEQEVLRLNKELINAQRFMAKIRLSEPVLRQPHNPDFDKKLSELKL